MSKTLMILPADRIGDWIRKGEVIDRYYNPGDVFEKIVVVLMGEETPPLAALQRLAGKAKVECVTLPYSQNLIFILSLGYQPLLLKLWIRKVVEVARAHQPDLIRCYGARVNAFAASEIKKELGIPYTVSLHINLDEDVRKRSQGLIRKLRDASLRKIEKVALCNANLVLPVYEPIVPYLKALKVPRYQVAYNMINSKHILKKENYELHDPVRIISVGRQFKEKDPSNLIKAIAQLQNVEFTLVGDGIIHEQLKSLVRKLKLESRVHFIPVLSNDELCRSLPDYDIFSVHTEYWEISKSLLEALLTGMPVLINKRLGEPVPELSEKICLLCDNSVESYLEGLKKLISDRNFRQSLGQQAYSHAQQHWSPSVTEEKFAEIYHEFI